MERTLQHAAQAMNADLTGDGAALFTGAVLDSRRVQPGNIFFALPGEHTDGHRFVATALAAGAAAAVVDAGRAQEDPRAWSAWRETGALLAVPDVLAALHDLTRVVRQELPQHLVGITGSAGKTTTKEMLAALLASRFRTAANPGNLNNLLGFPLALLGIPRATEWMVAEMGMSTPGELSQLSQLARPEAVVLTNVGAAHLESFPNLDAIAEAKAEVFEGLSADGLIVANADDERVLRIARRHHAKNPSTRLVHYGFHPSGDGGSRPVGEGHYELALDELVLDELVLGELVPDELEVVARAVSADESGTGSRFILETPSGTQAISLPLYGRHNVANALAAAACAWALGVELPAIAAALSDVRPLAGRGEVCALAQDITLIDDAYNANPEAVHSALTGAATLAEHRGAGRSWAVLGDMLELGPRGPELHREVGRFAARLGFHVLGVGEFGALIAQAARAAGGQAEEVHDATTAARQLPDRLAAGDLVLVKASRGAGLDVVVKALREQLALPAAGGPEGSA